MSQSIYRHQYPTVDEARFNGVVNITLYTRNRDRPRPIIHARRIYERSYMYQMIITWNELLDRCPQIIVNNPTIDTFKRRLKQHLVSSD